MFLLFTIFYVPTFTRISKRNRKAMSSFSSSNDAKRSKEIVPFYRSIEQTHNKVKQQNLSIQVLSGLP